MKLFISTNGFVQLSVYPFHLDSVHSQNLGLNKQLDKYCN